MKRWPLWVVLACLLVMLAYLFSNIVRSAVVQPFSYLWWYLNLIYASIPQVLIWFLFVSVLIIGLTTNFVFEYFPVQRKNRPEYVVPRGQVEELASAISRSKEGTYFRWVIANRMGLLADEILAQRSGDSLKSGNEALKRVDWNPSQKIGEYLAAGLFSSYADYPRSSALEAQKPTPLDLPAHIALDYLESQMEKNNGNHS